MRLILLGPRARQILAELLAHAHSTNCDDTRLQYSWTAPHIKEAAKQLVGVARMRGIAIALHRSAAARRAQRGGRPELDDQALDELFSQLREPMGASNVAVPAAAGPSAPSHASGEPEGGAAAALGAGSGSLGGASSASSPPPPRRAVVAGRGVVEDVAEDDVDA